VKQTSEIKVNRWIEVDRGKSTRDHLIKFVVDNFIASDSILCIIVHIVHIV